MDDESPEAIKIQWLARTLPSLRNAPGIDPWIPHELGAIRLAEREWESCGLW